MVAAAMLGLAVSTAPKVKAASFYWDATGAVVTGGSGSWDTTSTFWSTSSAGADPQAVSSFTLADTAYFTGTSGTATLTGPITIGGLVFSGADFTVAGASQTLTLAASSGAPTISVSNSNVATLSSIVAGTNGLAKTGMGMLKLTNASNSYTGVTTISSGLLVISSSAALGADTSAVVVSGSGTRGFGGGTLFLDGSTTGFTLSRNLSLQGLGYIADRSSALVSLGNNTLSGTVTMAESTAGTAIDTRITSVDGMLTLSSTSTLNVQGTAATTLNIFGGINQAGWAGYTIAGALAGTGTLEKTGAGTLFLSPSSVSGFAGSIRVTSNSVTGTTGTIRITSAGVIGSRTGTGASSVIDLNAGFLELRMNTPTLQTTTSTNANVYSRSSTTSTFFLDHGLGGEAVNGTLTLGEFGFAATAKTEFISRNGYSFTFGAAPVVTGDGDPTITNTLAGTLTFTGAFWSNTNTANTRTMNIAGNGNTLISGAFTASNTVLNQNLVKTGTGLLTINNNSATLDGTVSVQGSLAIRDFRAIGAATNAEIITLGSTTTTAGNLIIGGSTLSAPTGANLSTSRPIVLATTSASNAIYANQSGATGVTISGTITMPATTSASLILGGTSTVDNTISSAIPVGGGASPTGGLIKQGVGTWRLSGTNAYAGATTITAGTLKLVANAAASTIVLQATANTVVFNVDATTQNSGGTLEFVGVSGTASTEALGALTPTDGSGTVKLTSGGLGAAANLTFTSLGTVGKTSGVNFDVASGGAGTITLTGMATTTATTLPGSGHLYINGTNFAISTSGVLSAPSSYTAGGAIYNDAGGSNLLVASKHNQLSSALTTAPASISLTSLRLGANLTMASTAILTVNTGGVTNDGGILASATSTITASGTGGGVTTGGAGALVYQVPTSVILTQNAPILSTTTGGFTKNGAGVLVIGGANAQTGTTTINDGTVRLGASGVLSATSVALVIRQGGTLDLDGVSTGVAIGALNGSGSIVNGQSGTPAAATLTVGNGNGTGTFTGVIGNGTGSALSVTKTGTGAMSWLGSNTYTGVTTIGSTGLVTVNVMANGAAASGIGQSSSAASNLVFNGSTGGLVYAGGLLNGSLAVGSTSASTDRLFTLAAAATGATLSSTAALGNAIVWSNTGAISNLTTAAATLIFTGTSTGDNTFDPQLVNSTGVGTSALGISKTAAGQWNLGNSNNTYSGSTNIAEGILGLNDNGALSLNSPLELKPTSASSVAILQMSGEFTRSLSTAVTNGSPTVTFGYSIASTTGGTGFAAHTTPLVVAIGGTSSPTDLTWGSGGFVGTGGIQNLALSSTTALSSVNFRNAINLNGAMRTVNVLDNGNAAADNAILSGVLSGTGTSGLQKIGAGILKLTGANSYTGVTDIQVGTLVVSSLGSTTGGLTSSVGAAGVTMTDANAITMGNAGTGGTILQYVGPGETSNRKIRFNSTTGGPQIHADGSGALILTNVVNDYSSPTGAKTLSLRGSSTAGNTISSNLTNDAAATPAALSVTVDGGATWILSGTNTFTGSLTVSAGALGVGGANATGTGTFIHTTGSVFASGADYTISNSYSTNNSTSSVAPAFIGDYSVTITSAWVHTNTSVSNTITNSIVSGKLLTINGGISETAISAARTLTFNGSGDTVLNVGITTGTGFAVNTTYSGTGTLKLGGTINPNGGALTVSNGTVKLGDNERIPNGAGAAAVALSPAAGVSAIFDLNGFSETINGLTANPSGNVTINNSAAGAGTLTFGDADAAVTFGGGAGAASITQTGGGAINFVKTGTAAANFTGTLGNTGSTTVNGGTLNYNNATGTTSASVASGGVLNFKGGLTTPANLTGVTIAGGGNLSFASGSGQPMANLTTLSLGAGSGIAVIELDAGLSGTDILTLSSGVATASNTISLLIKDIDLDNTTAYTLISAPGGGLTAGGAIYTLNLAGYTGSTLTTSDTQVVLNTGTLITSAVYWNGGASTTAWSTVVTGPPDLTNFSSDLAGTATVSTLPGKGQQVIFIADSITGGGALSTTLEQPFKINSLVFRASTTPADTKSSITIAPGTVASNSLTIAPSSSSDGLSMATGATAAVTISAPLVAQGAQTWTVTDAAQSLIVSGALSGAGNITKVGAGTVTLSTAGSGYTGTFAVNAGNAIISTATALSGVVVTAGSGAAVSIGGTGAFYYSNGTGGTVPNPITLAGGRLSAGGAAQTYSGPIAITSASTINMSDANGLSSGATSRNITLSGAVTGSGALTIDTVNTASSGNQITGTATISSALSTWSGDLTFNRGLLQINAAASPNFTPKAITFNGYGKLVVQGVDAQTINRANTLTLTAGAVAELNLDNTTAVQATDFTINQNGTSTFGSAGTGASLRVLLNDAYMKYNMTGGVTLGGSSSISVANTADRLMTISGIISDGGNGYALALNDDAGVWNQTNGIIRLSGTNTFSGALTVASGIIEFSTVADSGVASNLGQGSAITLSTGTLRFIGSTNQSTNRSITLTADTTISTAGTAGTNLALTGAISLAANTFTLTGSSTSQQGSISGGITQTGTSADVYFTGGTWTVTGTNIFADDFIVTGASTVVNLNATGTLAYQTATSSGLYGRGGAIINIGADNVTGAAAAGGNDFILLGDSTNIGNATLNLNSYVLTTPRLDVGQYTSGYTADVIGSGILTVTTNINLYAGSVSAALAGAGPVLKGGPGTVKLAGDNSGLTSTTAVRVDAGILELDYSTNNSVKLRAATGLDMRGGALLVTGSAYDATSQTVASLTLASGGSNRITVAAGSGQTAVLNLGAITRTASTGTLRVALPSGVQSATNGVTTTNTTVNGAMGGYLTVSDASGVYFASKNATNNLIKVAATTKTDVSTWSGIDNVDNVGGAFAGSLAATGSINTLTFASASSSTVTLANGVTLNILSGGVLVSSTVSAGTQTITGGRLTSGGSELIFTHEGATTLNVASFIGGSDGVTKSGAGTLRLTNAGNVFTGAVNLQAGTLQAAGGNAIGDSSLITLADDQANTFQLLANESIGGVSGGNATAGLLVGTVALGTFNLTFNLSTGSTQTYAGVFTGSGTITRNGSSGGTNMALTGASGSGFTGAIVVNGGLLYLESAGTMDASSLTVNKGGTFLISNNGTTRSGTRLPDSMPIYLNSADGSYSGEVMPSGLAIRTDTNATTSETVGVLTLASGASYFRGTASGTTGIAGIITSNFVRQNNATLAARGRNLAATAGDRNFLRIADATTDETAFVGTMVGGAGAAATKTLSIIPWAIGQTQDASTSDGTMGNSLVTYATGTASGYGLRPLSLTTEYNTFASKAGATDNIREALAASLTGLTGTTINALVVDNTNTTASSLNVTGTGASQTLAVTSGTMLFTATGAITGTPAMSITLGGFDSGITVGSTNEYIVFVQNPTAAAAGGSVTATIDSPLTSTADITKSGRGSLILSSANTAGGVTKKTTINEGVLQVDALNKIGGTTGGLVFAGGTLKFGGVFDPSSRTVSFLNGGATFDTNGNDIVLASSIGSGGTGGFTKTGSGSLTLAASANYLGATSLQGSGRVTLNGSANNRLGLGDLTLASTAILQLGDSTNGASGQTVASLTGASTNTIVSGAAAVSTLTVNQPGNTTFAGSIGGAGANENNLSLAKGGAGTLTLSGPTLSFVGGLTVNAGTLSITGGATGAPAPSSVTVAAGGTLNLANSAGQAFNLGSGLLSLGSGAGAATLQLELGSSSAYDRIISSAAATASNAVVLNLVGITGFAPGNYNLITAASGLNGATYSIDSISGSPIAGHTFVLTSSPTTVRLAVTAADGTFYWAGDLNSSWLGFRALESNWTTNKSGTTKANGTPGVASSVVFSNDLISGTALATTLDAAFAIKDLTFNNQLGAGPLASISIAAGTSGTLTITPAASSAGINVQTGAPATITISAPVTLGGNQTWTVVDATTVLASSGGIGGTANLIKEGDGILTLSGTNNYTGSTTVNGGVLRAGAATGFNQTSAHTINTGAILRLNAFSATIGSLAGAGTVENAGGTAITLTAGGDNTSTIFSGVLRDGAASALGLTKLGTGSLTLSGTNTNTGNITVNGGTLNISGSWTGNTTATTLIYGGTSTSPSVVNVSGNMTLYGNTGSNVSGGVGVYNQTAGTVDVTGNTTSATYVAGAAGSYGYFNLTGGTFKERGRFGLGVTGNLASVSRSVVYIGGTGRLDHTNGDWMLNYSNAQVTVAGGGEIDRTGASQAFGLIMNSTTAGGEYGVLNVAGGSFLTTTKPIQIGYSTAAGSGNNNTAIINLAGGTLQVGMAISTSLPSDGANNAYLNFAGGTLKTSAAVANWIPTAPSGITFTSNLFGAINNSALTGAPSFTGGLTFNTNGFDSSLGTVLRGATGDGLAQSSLNVSGGSGYVGAPEVIFTGGTLVAGGSPAAGYALISNGAVTGIVITSPGAYSSAPTVTLNGGGGTGASVSVGTLVANASGGLTKEGAGVLTLSAANTYTGGTTINAGSLALGANNTLADGGNVTISGGTLNVATFNDTVATVSLRSGSITGSTGVLTSTSNFDLRNGLVSAILGGAVGLDKTTADTVTLSGANTYSGTTSITAGTLAFSAAGNLGNASATNTLSLNGGVLSFTPASTVSLSAYQVMSVGTNGGTVHVADAVGTLNLAGGITSASAANLTKTGLGTLTVTGSVNLNGGNVTVSAGVLQAGFTASGVGAIDVAAGASLNLYDGAATSMAITGLTLANGSALGFDLNGSGVNDSLSVTGSAAIAPSIALNFNNLGGLGVGSYDLLTVTSGTLDAADYVLGIAPSGLNYVFTTTNSGQTLHLSTSLLNLVYWKGAVSSSWSENLSAATNWTSDLAGSTDLGALPVATDTLVFSSTGAVGTALVTTLDGNFTADSLRFTANPSGVASVAINQGTSGTLTLAPASSNNGITVASNAGAITIGAPVATGSAQSWEVVGGGANGSSLSVSGTVAINHPINKTGAGSLVLSGSNTGSGGLNLVAGSLVIGNDNALGTGLFTLGAGTTIDTGAGAITNAGNNAQNWDGNFFFTGTNTLNLGTGVVTLGDNVIATLGNALTIGGAIGDGVSTYSITKTGAGSLTLNGSNTYGGRTTLTLGTLNLNGANSGAAGGVTMESGTNLNIGHADALGSGTLIINGGTLNNTSGGTLALGSSIAQNWNSSFTFTGNNDLATGSGAVTLGVSTTITVTAGTLSVGGVIDDGINAFGVIKTGAGTLSLGGVNTYGGATTLNQGALVFTADQSLTSAGNVLNLGSSAGSTSSFSVALSAASARFGGAMLVQTDNSTANNITIGAGKSLRVDGAVTIGYNSVAANSTTKLNITGASGTFKIGDVGSPTNQGFQLGNGGTSDISNAGTLDMSGLGTFYANLGTGTFRVGSATNGSGGSVAGSTLILAANSTIIAATVTSDVPDGTVVQAIKLGSGTNEINATTLSIGGGSNRGTGTLDFNTLSGTIKIRALDGSGRATMNVQNGGSSSGTSSAGTVDFSGHEANLLLGTLAVGGKTGAVTASGTGIFSFDTGTLDATTLNIAARTGTTSTSGMVTGTVTLGGGTTTIGTVTMATNSSTVSTTGDATATLNIGGGANTINTLTMGVNTVNAATGNGSNSDATINITGGVTTVNTTFTMGAQNSALNAATTVNSALSTLNISAGSLTLAGSTNLVMGATTLDANNAATAIISITGTGTLTVGGNIQYTNGLGTETNTVTLDGGTLDMTNGSIGGLGALITFNVQSGTLRNLAQLNNGGTLTKSTAGTLLMDTANAYTGQTAITAGVLVAANATALGTSAGGTSVDADAELRLQGGISIAAEALTLNGAGAASAGALRSLSGNNSFGGVITLATASRINSDADTLTLSGGVTSTNQNLTIGGAGNVTISTTGLSLGAGSLTMSGTGVLVLSVADTLTGGTTISSGTVRAGHANAFGSLAAHALALNAGTLTSDGTTARTFANNVTIGGNVTLGAATTYTGALTFNGTIGLGASVRTLTVNSNVTLAGIVSGTSAGGLTKTGNGTLTLSAANTYAGATNITGGTLATSGDARLASTSGVTVDASTTLSLGGNETLSTLANSGTVTIASGKTLTTGSSTDYSLTGTITGSGALTKAGASILTLSSSGTFSYTGLTTVGNGTLAYGASDQLGDANAVTVNGGILALAGFSDAVGAVTLTSGSITSTSGVLTAASITSGTASTATLSAKLSGAGTLTMNGSGGVLTVSGANDFTGDTTLSAGTLAAGSDTAFGTSALKLNGGTLGSDGSSARTFANNVTLGGNLALGAASTYTGALTFNGTINLGAAVRTLTANSDVTFVGAISNGGFIKAGSGTLTLLGDNTFASGTTISAGIVRAGHANAFGNLATHALALNGGTLTSDGFTGRTFANNVTLGGNIVLGAASTYTGALTFSGTIGLGAAVRTLTVNSNVTFAGSVSDGGLTKSGNGTLSLTGANTYTGATNVSAGTLNASSGALAGTSGITVGVGAVVSAADFNSGATITLSDATSSAEFTAAPSSVGAVSNAGTATNALNFSGTGAITVASLTGAGKTRFGGAATITGGISEGIVTVVGVATLTSVSAGTVNLQGATATIGTLTDGTVNLGTSTLSTALTVNSGTFVGLIAGTKGSLIKATGGTLTLTGANTYGGGTSVNAGILTIGDLGSLGSGAVTIAAGATLNLAGYGVSNTITVLNDGTNYGTVTGGPSATSPAVLAKLTGTNTIDTVLTGTDGLSKSDGGTLTLSTPNFYTGATAASGSSAVIKAAFLSDTSSSLGASTLSDPANLVLTSGAKLEFTGGTVTSTSRSFTINDSAGIASTGTGSLEFTTASTFATSGTDPELKLTASSAGGTNRFAASLAVGSAKLSTLAIDGTGTWVIGGGTNGANRFKGDVRIDANSGATLGFEAGSLGTGSGYSQSVIRISDNAVLVWSGANTDDISSRINLTAGTSVKFDMGANDVTFAAAPAVTGTGSTSIEKLGSGALKIATTVASPGLNFNVPSGLLAVNGSVGNVTLGNGSILGGSGTVKDVSAGSGSTVAPGNSPGVLTATSVALFGHSTFEWQVQDATEATLTPGYDKLAISGSLDLRGASVTNKITFKIVSLKGTGNGTETGNPLHFDAPAGAASIRVFNFATVQTGSNGVLLNSGENISDVFEFDLTQFHYTDSSSSNAGLWSINWNSANGMITLTAVPEPSTYGFGLGALALAAAAIRRRRKNQTLAPKA